MPTLTALSNRQDWLPDYLLDLRFLLHDPSANYFQDSELVSYINEARAHVCVDTGCLRKKVIVTLPGGIEAFPIGGVFQFNGTVPSPVGGTPPYVLVSGAGASGTADINQIPMAVNVTAGGSYYQVPRVTFDPGTLTVNISAQATAVMTPSNPASGSSPAVISSVYMNYDNGAFRLNNVTPAVQFMAVGIPATLSVDGNLNLQLVTFGSGHSGGVVIQDAAGVITPLTPAQVSMLDAKIASVDQVTVLWGSQRVPLRNYAYSDFSIQVRGIVGFQSVPIAFSVYASTLYIGPIPNQPYQYELDCIMYPANLLSYSEYGEIADRSSVMAVKYYAAYRARMSQDEADAAAAFLTLYNRETSWSSNRFTTRLSQLWPDNENLD